MVTILHLLKSNLVIAHFSLDQPNLSVGGSLSGTYPTSSQFLSYSQVCESGTYLGLKDREAFIYKHRYENADNELADFREWSDYLSQKCSDPKDTSDDFSNKGEGSRNKALQNEVRKLKNEIEKCKSEKNSEISALLREKNFVWNQFKMMESDYSKQLRKKSDEVEHANERFQALVNRAEELQIINESLRIDFGKMESESVKKSEEILRLLKEIELLKSKFGSASPLLCPCRTDAAASDRKVQNTGTRGRGETLKKESDPSQTSEKMAHRKRSAHKSTGGKAPRKQFNLKGSSSSKRKAAEVITIPDTPKLFTSNFKVPKLKSSSTPRRV
ncbi:uncharacterized protein LOC105166066 [Sesamum indicum]|uniref:Uncharacterized protein LOC105166066 n=1 Tax=Sesamum indicum TaxID=4182 RepID=A0A8M8UWQ9_SESIN|nr:uncharacterized protein LOC105166066 [Sesamum indicum]